MAERKHKWIAGAIRHPGALHRQLGVPEGEKIPASKLEKAARSDDPTLRRRAALAKTLKGFHHNEGGMVGSTGLMTDQRARAERMYRTKKVDRHG